LAGVIGGNAISPIFGNGEADLKSSRFEVSFSAIKDIPLGQTKTNNPEILLLLKLTKEAGAIDTPIYEMEQYFSAELRKESGLGSATCEWQSSNDGITFGLLNQLAEGAFAFQEDTQKRNDILLPDNVFFLRLILANSNATGVGQIQFLKFFVDLIFPQAYTLEQLV